MFLPSLSRINKQPFFDTPAEAHPSMRGRHGGLDEQVLRVLI
jgi:hypothetical protein